MFVLFVCRAHVSVGEGELPNLKDMFRPSMPFRDTWGWWGECLGKSQLVWELKHTPFPPYCAFLLGHSQMVLPDTRPTCVFGGECCGIDKPVRAASLAPHKETYDVAEVSCLSAEIPSFSCLQLMQNSRFPTSSLIAVSGIRQSEIPTILCW